MPVRFTNLLDYTVDVQAGTTATKLTHHWGFDADARFQTIATGQRRQLSTTGGSLAGMAVSIANEGVCKFVGSPDLVSNYLGRIGIITIEGVAEGDTTMTLADNSGKQVDQIAIHVTKWRSVMVRYYNLVDIRGRNGVANPDTNPLFSIKALSDLTDVVNGIVAMQCDVMTVNSGTGVLRDLKFSADLGSRVDIHKTNPYSSGDLDPAAEYHVAFVWAIDGGRHTNGITKGNFTLLDAALKEDHRQVTLAHEFVHFLSGSGVVTVNDHDDQHADLMFKHWPHGISMRKDRLAKIIHG